MLVLYCFQTGRSAWDILVLINSAVNFVVYCTMNRRFRYTLSVPVPVQVVAWSDSSPT